MVLGARGLVLSARCSVSVLGTHHTGRSKPSIAITAGMVGHQSSGDSGDLTLGLGRWEAGGLRTEICKLKFGKDGHGQRESSD